MCSTCVGTPVATHHAYNNTLQYPAMHRESGFEGAPSNRMLLPFQNTPQGASFHSQPTYSRGAEQVYNPQQFQGSGRDSPQPRPQTNCRPIVSAPRHSVPGGEAPLADPHCDGPREFHALRDAKGGRRDSTPDNAAENGRPSQSSLGRRGIHSTSTARTSSGGGNNRGQLCSLKDPTLVHLNNSPELLRNNSSKSSPSYTLSQRKQLRVEEKSYVKEVKRSIAEGRVPQVRLQQNNSGDIIQYKSQFLNALKLAALSIVPNADIDVKNQSTMQEIMEEVKRQFIIEKPLPEGMVAGFLQRLYKRNRSMYHRH